MIRITAKEYIQKTRQTQETKKPINRRLMPSVNEIARASGVTRQSIYNFLKRKTHKRIETNILNGFILAFRAYGHKIELSDLIRFEDEKGEV